jgi:hypothetical protein
MIYSTTIRNKVGDFELKNCSSYEVDIQILYKRDNVLAIRFIVDTNNDIYYYMHRWMYPSRINNGLINIELTPSNDDSYSNYGVCKIIGIDDI